MGGLRRHGRSSKESASRQPTRCRRWSAPTRSSAPLKRIPSRILYRSSGVKSSQMGRQGRRPPPLPALNAARVVSRKLSSDGAASLLKGTHHPLEEVILYSFFVCPKRGHS